MQYSSSICRFDDLMNALDWQGGVLMPSRVIDAADGLIEVNGFDVYRILRARQRRPLPTDDRAI